MLHHEYDALKGYRFLGGAISFYSVSCMSDVIFNPSLLNWSSLILTVAHMASRDQLSIAREGHEGSCQLSQSRTCLGSSSVCGTNAMDEASCVAKGAPFAILVWMY